MGVGLLATQLGQDLVELVFIVSLVGGGPVVEVVRVGDAVSVGGSSRIIVQTSEAVHHAAQALAPVAILQVAAFALERPQPVARGLQPALVVCLGSPQMLQIRVVRLVFGGRGERGGEIVDVLVDGAFQRFRQR
jgi:hypothetical protein